MMLSKSHDNSLFLFPRTPGAVARLLAGALLISSHAACDSDDGNATPDAAMETPDAAAGQPDAAPDGSVDSPDAGPAPVRLDVTATFDPARMELPEGLVIHDGVAYVGMAFTGEIFKMDLETGARESFARVALPPPVDAMTPGGTMTGLARAADGNLYATMDANNPEGPDSGIYRIPADGGDAELFAADPGMQFPNGIYVASDRLYVTDSRAGAVFEIALADGAVKQWVQHVELEPLDGNCGPAGIRLGANGIDKVGDAFYVANTDRAQIVKIPVTESGEAGTPEVFLGPDCSRLFGLDDVRAMPAGELVYAVNYGNRVDRVTLDKETQTLAEGAPLDGPASLEVLDNPLRVVVTNSAFGSYFSGQTPSPSLVTLSLE